MSAWGRPRGVPCIFTWSPPADQLTYCLTVILYKGSDAVHQDNSQTTMLTLSAFSCIAPHFPYCHSRHSSLSLCVPLSFYLFYALTFPSSDLLSPPFPSLASLLSPCLPFILLPPIPYSCSCLSLLHSTTTHYIQGHRHNHPLSSTARPIFSLSTDNICTNTNVGMMRDGFQSFRSGYSSCTLLFFSSPK